MRAWRLLMLASLLLPVGCATGPDRDDDRYQERFDEDEDRSESRRVIRRSDGTLMTIGSEYEDPGLGSR